MIIDRLPLFFRYLNRHSTLTMYEAMILIEFDYHDKDKGYATRQDLVKRNIGSYRGVLVAEHKLVKLGYITVTPFCAYHSNRIRVTGEGRILLNGLSEVMKRKRKR